MGKKKYLVCKEKNSGEVNGKLCSITVYQEMKTSDLYIHNNSLKGALDFITYFNSFSIKNGCGIRLFNLLT